MKNEKPIFQMTDADAVMKIGGLEAGKKFCLDKIEKSDANKDNKAKAVRMVNKSKTSASLALGVSNFILAFESLKVIK